MKKYIAALAAGAVLAVGCSDTIVSSVNAPTSSALNGALTQAGVQTLTLGVLAQDRALVRGDASYLILSEIYARDAYRIDPNEPRYVTETLGGTGDPGGFSGSGGWTNGYVAIRAANSLLAALPGAVTSQVTVAQRNATSGFVRTIKALDYYRLLELRDTLGIALQPADPTVVGPIICKTAALSYIAAVLDSANADLTAAGATTTLPLTLPSGFTGFGRDYSVVSNIVLFNRGLKGKVDLYRGLDHQAPKPALFATAVAELTQALGGVAPGAVPSSQFKTGAYLTFVSGGTENAANPLDDSRVGVNPGAVAALQAGDTRASKIIPFANGKPISGNGVATSVTYVGASTANTGNLVAPLAILRDEELVLLRAQANYEAGNLPAGDLSLNSVRTFYGLAPVTSTSLADARTNLLYEKRYSLFFEGPQRLVDLRAYGLLKAGITPAEVPGDPFNTAFPIPKGEADARGGRQNLTPVCS
jgi:hypothetical protein